MKRVEADEVVAVHPKVVSHFPDLVGRRFEKAYVKAEQETLSRQLKARDLYARMMKVLAETDKDGWRFKMRAI